MHRGDLYRVRHPSGDPKRSRVFVVVSRAALIRSIFSTVICAPVLTRGDRLTTQVPVGPPEGLKHPSWIMCDGLSSIEKARLTDFVGALAPSRIRELNRALRSALDLE
jgi:mRNA interferase MazF